MTMKLTICRELLEFGLKNCICSVCMCKNWWLFDCTEPRHTSIFSCKKRLNWTFFGAYRAANGDGQRLFTWHSVISFLEYQKKNTESSSIHNWLVKIMDNRTLSNNIKFEIDLSSIKYILYMYIFIIHNLCLICLHALLCTHIYWNGLFAKSHKASMHNAMYIILTEGCYMHINGFTR